MIDGYAAFGQDLLKVTLGNRITDIKEYSMQNYTFGEMSPFEINCHALQPYPMT